MAIYLVVDYENNAKEFWQEVQDRPDTPKEIRILGDEEDEIEVTAERGNEILAWCENVPGWDTGPEYAKYPIFAALRLEV